MTSPPPSGRVRERLLQLPEVVLRPASPAAGRRPRLLTPVYGSLRRSFSGSTWGFAQAGMAEGVLDGAFTLNPDQRFNPRLQANGAAWKLSRIMRGRKSGGFKFVQAFHDVLWRQNLDRLTGAVVVNNTQIYGPAFLHRRLKADVLPCFYIDGTLTEYIYGYGRIERQSIGRDMVEQAIAMEREGYAASPRIFTMSRATSANLQQVYGVDAGRITLVIPGSNLDDDRVPPPSPHRGWVSDEFTLGFVGLFPLRKGLDTLAAAVRILRGRGAPIRLKVIGRCPDEIAAMDGVDFLGLIDKGVDTDRFVRELRACDLGCQLSRAELLGIAMMEFLRVGVPVLATAVGGMPDVLEGGGGLLVAPEIGAEALAATLQELMDDPSRYATLRAEAVARAEWASWRRAAREVDAALADLG